MFAFALFTTVALAATGGSIAIDNVVSGGIANPSDFTVQLKRSVNGSTVVIQGNGDHITFSSLQPGTYTVSTIAGPANYTDSFGGSCSPTGTITVINGVSLTCTVNHIYGAPRGGGGSGGGTTDPRGGRTRPDRPARTR